MVYKGQLFLFHFPHRCIVVPEGTLLTEGAPKQIRNQPAVLIAYLGLASNPDGPMVTPELDPG